VLQAQDNGSTAANLLAGSKSQACHGGHGFVPSFIPPDGRSWLSYYLPGRGQSSAGGKGLRRNWVFDAERRERALEEAEGCLWATRAEHLREMA
jgi:hypothetical protein